MGSSFPGSSLDLRPGELEIRGRRSSRIISRRELARLSRATPLRANVSASERTVLKFDNSEGSKHDKPAVILHP